MTGPLLLPDSPTFATSRLLYNERFDAVDPSAIARCQTTSDVRHCVRFAREHAVRLAARSGGHSYGGYSTTQGLVVDVSALNSVQLAGDGAQAVVGAGTKLVDLYTSLGQSGVLLPGGSCPTVGIAGLALGGGVGVFGRKYGLTSDNIESVRLVTADGSLTTASALEHPDLYWACRGGGGGNFGVATSFTFSVHPIPDVTLFTLEWPWSIAGEVLGSWQSWMPGTPDELWSNCQLLSQGSAGNGAPFIVKVTGVFAGTTSACSTALQPLLRGVGASPTYSFVGPEDYLQAMLIEAGCEDITVQQCHLTIQGGTLPRSAFAAKSVYLTTALPDAGVTAVVTAVESLDSTDPSVGGGLVFDGYGGAINRIPAADTAFVHRDALACVQQSFSYSSGTPEPVVSAGLAWLDSTATSLSAYGSGAYQNYIDPTLEDWQQAYYGTNLHRLVSVKRAYDPRAISKSHP